MLYQIFVLRQVRVSLNVFKIELGIIAFTLLLTNTAERSFVLINSALVAERKIVRKLKV